VKQPIPVNSDVRTILERLQAIDIEINNAYHHNKTTTMIGKATNFAPAVAVKLAEKIIETPGRSVAKALTKRSFMSMSKMLQSPQSQDEEHFIVAVVLAVMNDINMQNSSQDEQAAALERIITLGLPEETIALILRLISEAGAVGKNTLQNVVGGLGQIKSLHPDQFGRLFDETKRYVDAEKVGRFLTQIVARMPYYIRSLMTNPQGLGRKTITMIDLQINRHLSPYTFLKGFRGERSDLYGGAQPKIKTRRVLHRSNHFTRSFR